MSQNYYEFKANIFQRNSLRYKHLTLKFIVFFKLLFTKFILKALTHVHTITQYKRGELMTRNFDFILQLVFFFLLFQCPINTWIKQTSFIEEITTFPTNCIQFKHWTIFHVFCMFICLLTVKLCPFIYILSNYLIVVVIHYKWQQINQININSNNS